MLNPLRPVQKNPSEEDSSGSDGGSEHSFEPETDRFGFFLTDGSTDGCAGPSPELVRQREAKWINIMDQWDQLIVKKTSKVKVQCQKGIPASLRAKCWPMLSAATDRMKQQKDLYKSLDSQPALKHWEDVIERDLDRQFPFHEMFVSKGGHGQRTLFQVLKALTQFQPEEGYCQAQGPVAAVLLMNMPAEEAFWCLVQISEQYLPGYYSPLLEGVLFDATILTWVLKRACPAAHKHLQHHGVEPLMFATDWLMCLFTRHLPFNTLLRVWDLFFCYGVRVLLQVAAVLVRRVLGREDQRKQCCGQMETLQNLRGVREEVKDEEDAFIAEVLSVPLSARDLQRQTEKELQKWKKNQPSSTFDPRGRCLGYQMAWARVRQSMEDLEKKEREIAHLSQPLVRSPSTLSLSPSTLKKKLTKGGKVNSGESKSGTKVVRHHSMLGKEDWTRVRSWADLKVKKAQDLQEEHDFHLEEKKKHNEPRNLTKQETQQKEVQEPKKQHIEIENVEKAPQTTGNLQTEQLKVNSEKDWQSTEDRKLRSPDENLDPTQPPAEDNLATSEQASQSSLYKESDQKVDDCAAQTDTNETVIQIIKNTDTEIELQQSVDMHSNRIAQVDKEENTSGNIIQQVETVTKEADRIPDSDSEDDSKHFSIEDTTEGESQQQQNKESNKYIEKHSSEGECQYTESLTGIEIKKESHTQTETHELTALDELENTTGQIDSEQQTIPLVVPEGETLVQGLYEGIQPQTPDISDKETRVTESTMEDLNHSTKANAAFYNDTSDRDQTEETTYCTEALHKQQPSTEPAALTLNIEADGVATSTSDQCAPERESQANARQADEELTTGNIQEKSKNDLSASHQVEGFFTDNQQYRRSRRSSGDFRVRKFSSSQESRQARRLSEDLFTNPQRTDQMISNHPDQGKHIETTQISNKTELQNYPSLTTDETEETATQKEQQPCNPPKRFGLFRRLREPPKNKKQVQPKMQIPKILIQDFSDEKEIEKAVKVEANDKLTSRERRRRRREQERREKEEGRQRKKDKELEKERRKPQTKGKSSQVQSEKDKLHLAGSQSSSGTSYAEAYF